MEADELALCEIFTCLPSQLEKEDTVKIARMCEIINIRNRLA